MAAVEHQFLAHKHKRAQALVKEAAPSRQRGLLEIELDAAVPLLPMFLSANHQAAQGRAGNQNTHPRMPARGQGESDGKSMVKLMPRLVIEQKADGGFGCCVLHKAGLLAPLEFVAGKSGGFQPLPDELILAFFGGCRQYILPRWA